MTFRRLALSITPILGLVFVLSALADDVDQALQREVDQALQREIVREISMDPKLDVVELGVRVDAGIARLSGQVATSAEKHLASRYANDVPGTQGVVNLIEVVPGLRHLDSQDE